MPKLSRNDSCIKYFQTHVCDHEDEYQIIYNDSRGTNSLCTICNTCSLIGSATLVCEPASCSGDVQKNHHFRKNPEEKPAPQRWTLTDKEYLQKQIEDLKIEIEKIKFVSNERITDIALMKKQDEDLWNNQKNQKNQLMSLKGTIIDIQKSLVKEEAEDKKPMLYACNKCGSKTNGLNEYANCKTGFCDGIYRKISKDKKSESIPCQCDNCGNKSLSRNDNELCFHCAKGIYKEIVP